MEKSDNLIKYYRERAQEYERIYYRDIPLRRKELNDTADDLFAIVKNKSVLDLACGTGYWTQIISTVASSVIACDISYEMLREALKKTYRCSTQFILTDLYHLPFAPHSFDIVTLGFWLSHEPKQNYRAFFQQLKELVTKDGIIWMIDNNLPAEGANQELAGKDSFGNSYKKRVLEDKREFVILKNYFTEDDLPKILAPYFKIIKLNYGKYYWSVFLELSD